MELLLAPEFSRIFAEIILQQIDRNVQGVLQRQSPSFSA